MMLESLQDIIISTSWYSKLHRQSQTLPATQ